MVIATARHVGCNAADMPEKAHPPNRLRELRERVGLTQAQLGGMVGVSGETIAKLERQERGLDLTWMVRLAPHLGVEPWALVPGAPEFSPKLLEILRLFEAFTPESQQALWDAVRREARYSGVALPPDDEPA